MGFIVIEARDGPIVMEYEGSANIDAYWSQFELAGEKLDQHRRRENPDDRAAFAAWLQSGERPGLDFKPLNGGRRFGPAPLLCVEAEAAPNPEFALAFLNGDRGLRGHGGGVLEAVGRALAQHGHAFGVRVDTSTFPGLDQENGVRLTYSDGSVHHVYGLGESGFWCSTHNVTYGREKDGGRGRGRCPMGQGGIVESTGESKTNATG